MDKSNNSLEQLSQFQEYADVEKLKEKWEKNRQKVESTLTPRIEGPFPPIVKGVKLKSFVDQVICFPNEWVRSALFSSSNRIIYEIDPLTKKKERIYYLKKRISNFSQNIEMLYTGYHLNLFDLQVYFTAIRESKTVELQRSLFLKPNEFCEASYITRGGKNIAMIRDSLDRLSYTTLSSKYYKIDKDGNKIEDPTRFYNDHLLYKFRANPETGLWEIALSEELARLYERETTHINWELWNSLEGDVTRSLMLHVVSHDGHPEKPQRFSNEMISKLLGLTSPMKRVCQLFRKAGALFLEKGIVNHWITSPQTTEFTRDPRTKKLVTYGY